MERRALPWMWSYVVFPFWIHQKKIDIAALVRFYEYPRPRPPISLSLQSQSVMVKPCCRPPSETPCSFCAGQFSWLEHTFCLARYPVHTGLFTPVCWKNCSLPEAILLLFPPGLRASAVVFHFHFMQMTSDSAKELAEWHSSSVADLASHWKKKSSTLFNKYASFRYGSQSSGKLFFPCFVLQPLGLPVYFAILWPVFFILMLPLPRPRLTDVAFF